MSQDLKTRRYGLEFAERVAIPERWAANILHALDVCYNEGIGPDDNELQEMVSWIVVTYPQLASNFDHIKSVRQAFERYRDTKVSP